MIRIFGANDTTFTSNGDIVIQPYKAKIHKSSSEDYLDIEVPIEYIDDIVQDNIAVVKLNGYNEPYRINNVTKTGKKISARCNHVFYDTKNHYFCEGIGTVTNYLYYVLSTVKNNVKPSCPYQFSGSMNVRKSVTIWYESLYDALLKIADKWNGTIRYSGYEVWVTNSNPSDLGIVIQYGKNLKDISCEEDWSEVCTRIYPIGANGITVDSAGSGLEHPYIDGATQYDKKYITMVRYDQSDIKRSSYSSQAVYEQALVADLIAKGEEYLSEHSLPKITYSVKGDVEKVSGIGMRIVVKDERLDIELDTRVISFDYDVLTQRYMDVTFGNYKATAKGMGNTVKSIAQNQSNGIVSEKRILFNSDNSVSWEHTTPQA